MTREEIEGIIRSQGAGPEWAAADVTIGKVLELCAIALKATQPEAGSSEAMLKAVLPFVEGFTYDPGHSDLDNEQPIHVRVTLGDWRRLHRLAATHAAHDKS